MSITTMPHLAPALPPEPVARISVEQYHVMIDAGQFANDAHVELLEGWSIPNMPKNPPHNLATGLVCDGLQGVLPMEWHLDCQGR